MIEMSAGKTNEDKCYGYISSYFPPTRVWVTQLVLRRWLDVDGRYVTPQPCWWLIVTQEYQALAYTTEREEQMVKTHMPLSKKAAWNSHSVHHKESISVITWWHNFSPKAALIAPPCGNNDKNKSFSFHLLQLSLATSHSRFLLWKIKKKVEASQIVFK